MAKTLTIGSLLFLFSSCNLLDQANEGQLIGRSLSERIVLMNMSDQEAFHFVVGRRLAALINWAPGVTEGAGLAPGKSISINARDISQSGEEDEVIVYWWHAINVDGELQAGEVRNFILGI